MTFKKIAYRISLILIISSCKTKELYKKVDTLGTLKTCVADSTSLFTSDKIEIDYKHWGINSNCPNAPHDPKWTDDNWPSQLYLNLKEHKFNFRCYKNFKHHVDTIDGTPVRVTTGKIFEGTCNYDKRKKLLTLFIPELKWQRTFKSEFDFKESKLFLLVQN